MNYCDIKMLFHKNIFITIISIIPKINTKISTYVCTYICIATS